MQVSNWNKWFISRWIIPYQSSSSSHISSPVALKSISCFQRSSAGISININAFVPSLNGMTFPKDVRSAVLLTRQQRSVLQSILASEDRSTCFLLQRWRTALYIYINNKTVFCDSRFIHRHRDLFPTWTWAWYNRSYTFCGSLYFQFLKIRIVKMTFLSQNERLVTAYNNISYAGSLTDQWKTV